MPFPAVGIGEQFDLDCLSMPPFHPDHFLKPENHMLYRALLMCAIVAGLAACDAGKEEPVNLEARAQIDTARLSDIVKVMAADEFEGRAPGTPGEDRTVAYLVEQFTNLGLVPGGQNGSWTQTVPMIHTQVQAMEVLSFSAGDALQPLQQKVDIEISTVRAVESIGIDAPVVFVGFGASAPERDWDDFGDIDLEGKVALFLVNDPDFAATPGEAVAGRFGDRRMTYYARWT